MMVNEALASRLLKMADECKDADDSENTHGTLIQRVSGFVYDDLTEAARLLSAPPPQADKARGEVAEKIVRKIRARASNPGTVAAHGSQYADGLRAAANIAERFTPPQPASSHE